MLSYFPTVCFYRRLPVCTYYKTGYQIDTTTRSCYEHNSVDKHSLQYPLAVGAHRSLTAISSQNPYCSLLRSFLLYFAQLHLLTKILPFSFIHHNASSNPHTTYPKRYTCPNKYKLNDHNKK